jgi:hypothetical protein
MEARIIGEYVIGNGFALYETSNRDTAPIYVLTPVTVPIIGVDFDDTLNLNAYLLLYPYIPTPTPTTRPAEGVTPPPLPASATPDYREYWVGANIVQRATLTPGILQTFLPTPTPTITPTLTPTTAPTNPPNFATPTPTTQNQQVVVRNPNGSAYLRPDFFPIVPNEDFYQSIGVSEVLVIGKAVGREFAESTTWYLVEFAENEQRFIHQNDLMPFDDSTLKAIPILRVPVSENITLYPRPNIALTGELIPLEATEDITEYYLHVLSRSSTVNINEPWVKILWEGEERWLLADLFDLSVPYADIEIEVETSITARVTSTSPILEALNKPDSSVGDSVLGDLVTVLYQVNYVNTDWFYIETSSGLAGWVHQRDVVLNIAPTIGLIPRVRLATQIFDNLNVRTSTDQNSDLVRAVAKSADEIFVIIADVQGRYVNPGNGGVAGTLWYQLLDGTYIHSGIVTIISN